MPGGPVSSINVIIESLPVNDKNLQLVPGEIVRGEVKEVKDDGSLLLSIKGKLLEAQSEVKTAKGQIIQLQFEDIKDGKIILKMLGADFISKLDELKLSAHLKSIGVNPGELELKLANKLLQYQLPVTAKNINELSKGISLLGESTNKNIDMAAFALSRNIPATKGNFELVARYFANTDAGEIFNKINVLLSALPKTPEQTAAASNNPTSPYTAVSRENSPALLSQNPEPLAKPSPGYGAATGAAKESAASVSVSNAAAAAEPNLKSSLTANPVPVSGGPELLTENAGQNISGKTARGPAPIIPEGEKTAAPPANTSPSVNENTKTPPGFNNSVTEAGGNKTAAAKPDPPLNFQNTAPAAAAAPELKASNAPAPEAKILTLLTSLLEELIIKPDAGREEINSRLKNALQQRGVHIQNLNAVQQILTDAADKFNLPLLKELGLLVSDAARELSAQQYINVSNRANSTEQNSFLYFSLPVQWGQEQKQLQVRVNKNRKGLNPSENQPLSLAVSLDTDKLGLVVFHVNWQRQNRLLVRGVVQSGTVKEHIASRLPSLTAALQALGFDVTDMGLKVMPVPGAEAHLRSEPEKDKLTVNPWVIDIKI